MFRREIRSSDGSKLWLLISQVEHAHLSGELTRHWREEFTPDVVDAITHHDDGWAAWEADPKLNPEIGAPFSFLEMPPAAAMVIWDHSIEAAGKFGPLAAYIVAGHFYNLLSESEHANDPLAVAWLTAKRKLRTSWLDEWVRADSSHTLEYAKQAQHMLLLADLFSLWLCCDCPIDSPSVNILDDSSMKPRIETLRGLFQFESFGCTIRRSASDGLIEELAWSVGIAPYPFKEPLLSLSAAAVVAPRSRYANWEELSAASWPCAISWLVSPANKANCSKC